MALDVGSREDRHQAVEQLIEIIRAELPETDAGNYAFIEVFRYVCCAVDPSRHVSMIPL